MITEMYTQEDTFYLPIVSLAFVWKVDPKKILLTLAIGKSHKCNIYTVIDLTVYICV